MHEVGQAEPLARHLAREREARLPAARQGKTQLAMANISGSMMVQATVPAGIGLLFTPWHFDTVLVSASLATLAAVTYLRVLAATDRLRPGWVTGTAAFYGAFAVALAVELR